MGTIRLAVPRVGSRGGALEGGPPYVQIRRPNGGSFTQSALFSAKRVTFTFLTSDLPRDVGLLYGSVPSLRVRPPPFQRFPQFLELHRWEPHGPQKARKPDQANNSAALRQVQVGSAYLETYPESMFRSN